MADRLRVLVCAHDCSPVRGSEAGVGWGWVRALASFHDVSVIAAAHFGDEIEAELDRRPELREHLRFHYVNRSARRAILSARKVWPPIYLASYRYQWQRAAFRLARALHAQRNFEVVHQLTYVGFRVPGYLWQLGIPFVWGPIGGLDQTPWRLFGGLGLRGAVHFACRNVLNICDKKYTGLTRRAMSQAHALISATSSMQEQIQTFYGRDSFVIAEVGLPPITASQPAGRNHGELLRLAWCGNHDPGKALPVLLRALAQLPQRTAWELNIFGSGSCTPAWKKLCAQLGLEKHCRWWGQVTRMQFLGELKRMHVFAISSLHDLTSTVLVEALASGVPVVCPDLYGFRDAVTPACGIRVGTESLAKLESGLCDAILFLHDHEHRRRSLAFGALKQAANYSWDSKAAVLQQIYRQVCARQLVASASQGL